MTELERKNCLLSATILKSLSKQVYCLLLTIPLFCYCFFLQSQNIYAVVISFAGIISGIFIGFRAWHLYFDAQLFKNIAENNQSLETLDTALYAVFRKKTKTTKDTTTRIHACYKLSRIFLLVLVIHVILALLIFCLYIRQVV